MKRRWFVLLLVVTVLLVLGIGVALADTTINVSTFTDGQEVTLNEYCTINIDADKTIKCINAHNFVITGDGTHTLTVSERIGSPDGANPSYRPDFTFKSGNLVVNGYMYINTFAVSGGNIKVTHTNNTSNKREHAINCLNAINITGGSVEASASIDDGSNGIYSGGKINISGGAVKASGQGNGIYASSIDGITISGGAVTTEGQKNVGLNSTYITITGGAVNATGANYGIEGYINNTQSGKVEITSGTVNATGGHYGIYAGKSVKLSGGTVVAKGTKTDYSNGIYVVNGTIEISDGITRVTADCAVNSLSRCAITAYNGSSSDSNPAIILGDNLFIKEPAGGTVRYDGSSTTSIYDSNNKRASHVLIEPGTVTNYTVTYKVVNGTWSDGSTADQTETVSSGASPASVPTGMKAASGYTGGVWDTDPTTATITANTTFTYTFTAEEISYSTVDVKGAEHTIDNGEDAVITVKRSVDDEKTYPNYTGATMDGKAIPDGSSTTAQGSLILTLKASYLDTLSVGDHKVTISFTDGEAEASLKIKAASETPTPTPTPTPTKVPKTGDSANFPLWLGLILLGLIGIGGATIMKYRKRG